MARKSKKASKDKPIRRLESIVNRELKKVKGGKKRSGTNARNSVASGLKPSFLPAQEFFAPIPARSRFGEATHLGLKGLSMEVDMPVYGVGQPASTVKVAGDTLLLKNDYTTFPVGSGGGAFVDPNLTSYFGAALQFFACAFVRYRVTGLSFHYRPSSIQTTNLASGVFAYSDDPLHPRMLTNSGSTSISGPMAVGGFQFPLWQPWDLQVRPSFDLLYLYDSGMSNNADFRLSKCGCFVLNSTTAIASPGTSSWTAGMLYWKMRVELFELAPEYTTISLSDNARRLLLEKQFGHFIREVDPEEKKGPLQVPPGAVGDPLWVITDPTGRPLDYISDYVSVAGTRSVSLASSRCTSPRREGPSDDSKTPSGAGVVAFGKAELTGGSKASSFAYPQMSR